MLIDILNSIEPLLSVEHLEGLDHAGHDHAGHDHAEVEHAGHDHSGHSHGGEEGQGVLKDAWSLITDPAHAIAELFFNVLDNLIIVPVTVYLYKKFAEPVMRRRIHQEIDSEHGIDHDACKDSPKQDAAVQEVK